jgi:hypothetical protein
MFYVYGIFIIYYSRPEGKDYTIQRLLIGTHTSDNDQNYVEIANVQLPKSDSDIDPRKYEEEKAGFMSHIFEEK